MIPILFSIAYRQGQGWQWEGVQRGRRERCWTPASGAAPQWRWKSGAGSNEATLLSTRSEKKRQHCLSLAISQFLSNINNVFWPAFECCIHPKAGRNTLLGPCSTFFVHFKHFQLIFCLKSRKTICVCWFAHLRCVHIVFEQDFVFPFFFLPSSLHC